MSDYVFAAFLMGMFLGVALGYSYARAAHG
jgi:hypothetical protein